MGIRLPSRRIKVGARVLAFAMALEALVAIRPAAGSPGDIYSTSAPAIGTDPPKAADIQAGDASVSTQTGQFGYSFPIAVPPGRGGMAPHLSLVYSSQAPIYGSNLGAGWSMPVPIIMLDTSNGRLATQGGAKVYASSMAGGRPLVPVSDEAPFDYRAFRAQNDATFARYIKSPNGLEFLWQVLETDGTTQYFGDRNNVSGAMPNGLPARAPCPIVSDEYAPLTRSFDSFGNQVNYYYSAGVDSSECVLRVVTWGRNDNASLPDFAMIVFSYSANQPTYGCPSSTLVGAQTSYRTGTKITTGASRLDSITVTAYAPGAPSTVVHTRNIALSYDPPPNSGAEQTWTCSATHAAYRTLYSITETAQNTDPNSYVSLPAITFSYGSAQFGTGTLTWNSQPTHQVPWSDPAPQYGVLSNPYSVAWGFRFNDSRWPTVEAMLVDIDGDGLLDRLSNRPVLTTDANGLHFVRCGAQWERNMGPGQPFASPHTIDMPTLKWADVPGSYGGGSYSNAQPVNQFNPINESCSLNYQRTYFQNSDSSSVVSCWSSGLGSYACPSSGYCLNGSDCGRQMGGSPMVLAYRWIDLDNDGLVDLVASPTSGAGSYNLQQGTGLFGQVPNAEPGLVGNFADYPCTNPYVTSDPVGGYTMCGGEYVWFFYKNTGNGHFGGTHVPGHNPTPTAILYEPVPLESDTGDSSITSWPMGLSQGMVDVDGDGFSDGNSIPNNSSIWNVYRNHTINEANRVPQLVASSGASPFPYPASLNDLMTKTDCPLTQVCNPFNSQGLLDLNGDGLADHWITSSDHLSATAEINDGIQFRQPAEVTLSLRPGNDAVTSVSSGNYQFVINGNRVDTSSPRDVDLDGLVDLYQNGGCYLNQGGNFGLVNAGIVGDSAGLSHTMVTSDSTAWPYYSWGGALYTTWAVLSDMIDLDGDGIPEGVDFATNPLHMNWTHVSTPTAPPRLLVSVDNGRGAHTTISYAAMSNTAVVEQHPEIAKSMPHTQWVVQSMTTTDDLPTPAATVTTTSYYYKNPHFGPDDQTRYGFRGFEEVTTTAQSGAQTVQTYSYSPDWSGQLTKTLVMAAPSERNVNGEVRSIAETTYTALQLYNGVPAANQVTTYHPTQVDHWTCDNGEDETACLASTNGFTRTTTTLTRLGSTTDSSGPYMWKTTSVRLQGSPTSGDGDRISTTSYVLAADGENYRLLTQSVIKTVITGGNPVTISHVEHTFDVPNYTVALTDKVWVDNDPTHPPSITRRAYDPQTGNVTQRWKPNQNSQDSNGDGASALYTYDDRKLFVAEETLEPAGLNNTSQIRDYLYEYGTGTKIETIGPNIAPCYSPTPHCPPNTPPKEDHRIVVDGLGRTLQRYDVFADQGAQSYIPVLVEKNTYVNGPAASVEHQSAFDGALSYVGQEIRYTDELTELDGHGRPFRKTVQAQGAAPAPAISTFTYRNDGTLQSVAVPDPSANDTSTVTFTYAFDSLGRPVNVRRPDGTGLDMSYDGLTATSIEHVSPPAVAASTRTTKDNFGRLQYVDEQLDSQNWARTTYGYDANDNVQSVQDPEGVATTMTHDFTGHRTSITRYGRTWTYKYDNNGNVYSEVTPGWTSDVDKPLFTTTIVYDDLDRPISKAIAPRNLSPDDLALFGSSMEAFYYDYGGAASNNASGRLTYWTSSAPGASTPTIFVFPTFDAQGLLDELQEYTSGIAGSPALARMTAMFHDLGGSISATYPGDGVGPSPTTGTYSDQILDARGLPLEIEIIPSFQTPSPTPYPTFFVANTRNVAGLVTKQQGPVLTSPSTSWPNVESDWTYDNLGHVTSQKILVGTANTQVARQDLSYFGNDDIHTLDQYLPTGHRTFTYTFDTRHQITAAAEATSSYFSATYGYGSAGRFASSSENTSLGSSSGTQISNRNVNYTYAGASGNNDPEEVVSLTSGSTTVASFQYDAIGNQTLKCLTPVSGVCQGGSYTYLYDGKDQLRRATHFDGSGALLGSEEYWYDLNGSRMFTVKRDGNGNKTEMIWWFGDNELHYVANGNHEFENYVSHAYSYISMGGAVVRVDRVADQQVNVEYEFHGLAGSTLATIDQITGDVNSSFSYSPFGEIIEATDNTTDNFGLEGLSSHRRRWNDKFVDEISELAYYGHRFYDRATMTWTQGDPLFRFAPDARWTQPRRGNLYTYSMNNPVRYMDPDGLLPTPHGSGASIPATTQQFTKACDEWFETMNNYVRAEGDWAEQFDQVPESTGAGTDDFGHGGLHELSDLGSNQTGSCPPGAMCEEGNAGSSTSAASGSDLGGDPALGSTYWNAVKTAAAEEPQILRFSRQSFTVSDVLKAFGIGAAAAAGGWVVSELWAAAAAAGAGYGAYKGIKSVMGSGSPASLATPAPSFPQNATDTLKIIRQTGSAPPGYKGGGTFANDGRNGGQILPRADTSGKPLTYREWDVNPFTKGVNRGKERIVTGSDGTAYWTNDHYISFTKMP